MGYGKIRVRRNLTHFIAVSVYFYLGKNTCSISHTNRYMSELRRSKELCIFRAWLISINGLRIFI